MLLNERENVYLWSWNSFLLFYVEWCFNSLEFFRHSCLTLFRWSQLINTLTYTSFITMSFSVCRKNSGYMITIFCLIIKLQLLFIFLVFHNTLEVYPYAVSVLVIYMYCSKEQFSNLYISYIFFLTNIPLFS